MGREATGPQPGPWSPGPAPTPATGGNGTGGHGATAGTMVSWAGPYPSDGRQWDGRPRGHSRDHGLLGRPLPQRREAMGREVTGPQPGPRSPGPAPTPAMGGNGTGGHGATA